MKWPFMWSLTSVFITSKTELENWNYPPQKNKQKTLTEYILQGYDYLIVSKQITFKMHNAMKNLAS